MSILAKFRPIFVPEAEMEEEEAAEAEAAAAVEVETEAQATRLYQRKVWQSHLQAVEVVRK